MHEYGITENIIKTAVEEAEKHGAKKIKFITLVIGELSSIVDESIQLYFDILSEGTVAEGAQLTFRYVRAQLECRECGKRFDRKVSDFECPHCGGIGKLTDVGKEFYIDSIEVE